MTTMDKIEKALQMINEHDWWWAWAEYCGDARDRAYSHMRAFVELISEISNKVIVATLRELWEVTAHKAWTDDKEEKAKYESIRVELMATILPSEIKMAA
ncbi:hypothetical protein NXW18_13635 [Bacteroides thetaiotaomicron]|uniref:hypothetical protein n=1 Tax=Bacteroides thetaiotaomicron TaxID=818 RepID=UPI002166999F|nr:hypothetical protein [Bacteroides thetaiotaomicron]MCS2714523.1 hypothetical protein [Bacteroides thetaiotaomicron]MCS2874769.1 hypothetical protein [Bacteroides thetaiotaomicron]